jgi:hypothetical protein
MMTFLYTVLLDSTPIRTHADELVVVETETAGHGLVLAEDRETLTPGEILAAYPGPAEWMTEDAYLSMHPSAITYVFVHGPMRSTSGETVFLVWNPQVELESPECKACFANTSHPSLPAPYTTNNCIWGLYFGEKFSLDISVPPDAHLYIVSSRYIHPGDEILLDYHWQLSLTRLISCGDRDCLGCYENTVVYMSEWQKYLGDSQALPSR